MHVGIEESEAVVVVRPLYFTRSAAFVVVDEEVPAAPRHYI